MIDDYEDIFTDESGETVNDLDEIDSSEGKDGCQFYFLPDGKFHEKSLPTQMKITKKRFTKKTYRIFFI